MRERDHGWLLRELSGAPVVFLDRPPHGIAADAVLLDNLGGGRQAAEHLLEQRPHPDRLRRRLRRHVDRVRAPGRLPRPRSRPPASRPTTALIRTGSHDAAPRPAGGPRAARAAEEDAPDGAVHRQQPQHGRRPARHARRRAARRSSASTTSSSPTCSASAWSATTRRAWASRRPRSPSRASRGRRGCRAWSRCPPSWSTAARRVTPRRHRHRDHRDQGGGLRPRGQRARRGARGDPMARHRARPHRPLRRHPARRRRRARRQPTAPWPASASRGSPRPASCSTPTAGPPSPRSPGTTSAAPNRPRTCGGSSATRFAERVGMPVRQLCSLVKYAWMREHWPDAARGVRWLSVAEWIVRELGGEEAAESSLASRTAFYDLHTREPWDEALAWAGAPPGLAPEHLPAGHAARHRQRRALAGEGRDARGRRPRPPGRRRRRGRGRRGRGAGLVGHRRGVDPRDRAARHPTWCASASRPASPSAGTPSRSARRCSAPPARAPRCSPSSTSSAATRPTSTRRRCTPTRATSSCPASPTARSSSPAWTAAPRPPPSIAPPTSRSAARAPACWTAWTPSPARARASSSPAAGRRGSARARSRPATSGAFEHAPGIATGARGAALAALRAHSGRSAPSA